MKATVRWRLIIPATVLSVTLVVSALGQSNPTTINSTSMAGAQAGLDPADAAKYAREGAATVLPDTRTTAKLKTASHRESATERSGTHAQSAGAYFAMPLEALDNE
jgi:hypothetical protein